MNGNIAKKAQYQAPQLPAGRKEGVLFEQLALRRLKRIGGERKASEHVELALSLSDVLQALIRLGSQGLPVRKVGPNRSALPQDEWKRWDDRRSLI